MARRTPLVCQHLENISRDALEKYQDIIRDYVRRRQGVYALYRRGKLYYVGLASNLRSRLAHHLKDRHGESWDRFSVYLTIGDSHLRELESLILRIVKPSGNRNKGRFAQSQDVRRLLGRDLRARMNREVSELLGKKHAMKPSKPKAKQADGRKPTLAEYITRPMRLRARFKRKTINARVRRTGLVTVNGKTFTSPSLAAAFACARRTCNGWTFWQYERAPGDWVLLDNLRK